MTLFSQAGQMGQEMVKDPASYVAAAAVSAPVWLSDLNSWIITATALAGFIFLLVRIRGAWLHNKGLSLDNEEKKRKARE